MPVQKFAGLHPKKFGGKNHAKFGAISDTFFLWARISPKRIEIFKIWKPGALQLSLPRSTKKVPWTLVHFLQIFRSAIVRKKLTSLEDHISTPRGCSVLKFLHTPQNRQVLLANTAQGMRVPQTIFYKGGSKIGVINYYFFCVEQKISGELLSRNHKAAFAHFNLLNIDSARIFGHWQGVNRVFNCGLFQVICKKIGGLKFTNHKVVFAHFDLPNIDSSWVYGQL